jgi:hypothetical protein
MLMHKGHGNQQLDADEEKEKPSLVLPSMFGKRESVSGDQGERIERTNKKILIAGSLARKVRRREGLRSELWIRRADA